MVNYAFKNFHLLILLIKLQLCVCEFKCPRQCICDTPEGNEEGIKTITCSNEIPDSIPSTVTTFVLKMTSVSNMKNGMIGNFSSLKVLDLQRADIHTIEDKAFVNLVSLEEFRLSNNLITRITNYTFSSCVNLKILHLDRNKLKEIELGAFVKLNNLRELHLSDNSLRYMPTLLPELLLELNLRNNFIAELPNTLLELNSLKRLDMCGNKYTSFLTATFDAPNLKYLCLGDELIDFDKKCVSKISKLQSLKIISKEIDYEILLEILSQLNTLDMLDLSDSTILSSQKKNEIQWQNLTFPNLRHLRMSKTTIKANLSKDFIKTFPNINILDLKGSPQLVREIFSEKNYTAPTSIATLVLANSNIRTLKNEGRFQNLKTLDISDNPLTCDCDIKWIIEKGKNKTLILEYPNQTFCHFPHEIKTLKINSNVVYEKICPELLRISNSNVTFPNQSQDSIIGRETTTPIQESAVSMKTKTTILESTIIMEIMTPTEYLANTTEITTPTSEKLVYEITIEHIFYTLLILSILVLIIIIVIIIVACKQHKRKRYNAVTWRYKKQPQNAASCSSSVDEFTIPEIIKESKEHNKRSTAISASSLNFN